MEAWRRRRSRLEALKQTKRKRRNRKSRVRQRQNLHHIPKGITTRSGGSGVLESRADNGSGSRGARTRLSRSESTAGYLADSSRQRFVAKGGRKKRANTGETNQVSRLCDESILIVSRPMAGPEWRLRNSLASAR